MPKKARRNHRKNIKIVAKITYKSMKTVTRFWTGSRAGKNQPLRDRLGPEERHQDPQGSRGPPSGCPPGPELHLCPRPQYPFARSFIPDLLQFYFWIFGLLPQDSNRIHHRCDCGDWISNLQAKGEDPRVELQDI